MSILICLLASGFLGAFIALTDVNKTAAWVCAIITTLLFGWLAAHGAIDVQYKPIKYFEIVNMQYPDGSIEQGYMDENEAFKPLFNNIHYPSSGYQVSIKEPISPWHVGIYLIEYKPKVTVVPIKEKVDGISLLRD